MSSLEHPDTSNIPERPEASLGRIPEILGASCARIPETSWLQLPEKVQYLVFSGGAGKGYAHLGVLNVLQSLLKLYGKIMLEHMKGFGGSSFGALLALACSLNLDYDIMETWFMEVDTASIFAKIDVVNFWQRRGLLRNTNIETKIVELMKLRFGNPENFTFEDLYRRTKKHLRVVMSNVSDCTVEYWDHVNHPKEKVIKAVVASMALPTMFEPVELLGKLYADGGTYMNSPVDLFPASQSLILRIDSQVRLETTEPSTPQYLLHLVFSAMEFYERNYLGQVSEEYKQRIIPIKVNPCGAMDMMSPPTILRQQFVENGEKAAMDYFIHTTILGQVMRMFFQYKIVKNNDVQDDTKSEIVLASTSNENINDQNPNE